MSAGQEVSERAGAIALPVGTTLAPQTVRVTRAWLERFARGMGVSPDVYTLAPGRVSPLLLCYEPGYLPALAAQRERPGRATLAISIEWQGHASIGLDETITIESAVTGRWVRRGREYVQVRLAVLGPDGGRACTFDYVEAWSPADRGLPEREGASGGPPPANDYAGAPAWHTARLFTAGMLTDFARDDPNIHNDAAIARSFGFDAPVLAGVQEFMLHAELCAQHLGRDFLAKGTLSTRFLRTVLAGANLQAQAFPAPMGADGRPCWALRCLDEHDGSITAVGQASM
ncbi:MAG: hypothetical protein V4609_05250 [Pseudomonadota bacterium]